MITPARRTHRGRRDTGTAIEVAGLRKSYGDNTVLAGIDFTVPAGTVFSMLGPNGAGKTTTVQILSTLIRADAGDIRVAGHDLDRDPHAVRESIGVTGQFSAIDKLLTGEENLRLMADLNHLSRSEGRRRAAELLRRFDLEDAAKKQPATYSGGMVRRLDLAMTLMGDPDLIFLDEPTTGVDPAGRRVMWNIIRDLVADGVTIFLTTQYLEEADELSDQVVVLNNGTLAAQGTPAELKRMIPGGHITLAFDDRRDLDTAASTLTVTARDDEALTLQTPGEGGMKSLRALLARLDAVAVEPADLSIHTPDLDDVFLALTGHATTAKDGSR